MVDANVHLTEDDLVKLTVSMKAHLMEANLAYTNVHVMEDDDGKVDSFNEGLSNGSKLD